mmetsp:Transcript_26682/g.89322  ORF Transcript_26682/g.89322 Transcript_26682/m.89322 type:complete len:220 (+) Transcript_26682:172-831(+)
MIRRPSRSLHHFGVEGADGGRGEGVVDGAVARGVLERLVGEPHGRHGLILQRSQRQHGGGSLVQRLYRRDLLGVQGRFVGREVFLGRHARRERVAVASEQPALACSVRVDAVDHGSDDAHLPVQRAVPSRESGKVRVEHAQEPAVLAGQVDGEDRAPEVKLAPDPALLEERELGAARPCDGEAAEDGEVHVDQAHVLMARVWHPRHAPVGARGVGRVLG